MCLVKGNRRPRSCLRPMKRRRACKKQSTRIQGSSLATSTVTLPAMPASRNEGRCFNFTSFISISSQYWPIDDMYRLHREASKPDSLLILRRSTRASALNAKGRTGCRTILHDAGNIIMSGVKAMVPMILLIPCSREALQPSNPGFLAESMMLI